jgi:hypothetical protein
MKKIRTEVIIQADSDEVWSVLTQFEKYIEWNPFIHITGDPGLGNVLENKMFLDENEKAQIFTPTITHWEDGKRFAWLGSLFIPGIFDGEHYFEVHQLTASRVKVIQGENFSGLLSSLVFWMIGKKTKSAFTRMNSALKLRAESI